MGGDAYTAPVVAVTQSGTTTYYYLLRDHLGTITHLVNTSNTVVLKYSFDAWGRRRVADDWEDYDVSSEPALFAGRGFTAHEYLPWFDLYNMNGRLYDPMVGRFLSPDENVQMPDYTQDYNRFTYCFNNPLVYVDPDGEFPIAFVFGAIIGGYIGGSIVNKDWSPWNGGWNWKDPGTYFGITFGALTGGLGAQWIFGPEGVLSGKTMVDINVGVNINNAGTAFVDFSFGQGTGLTFEGFGYATLAGGGAYFTATMIKNWVNGRPNVSPEQKIDLAITKAQPSGENSYYNTALTYENVPYLYGGMTTKGIDCSGLINCATGNETRIWTTSMGNPPGNWEKRTVRTSSYDNFILDVQMGDLFLWTNKHAAFYAGNEVLFHAHGKKGTPTGYTYDLKWWISNKGYPDVFRQQY